jgi:hypothetical protein
MQLAASMILNKRVFRRRRVKRPVPAAKRGIRLIVGGGKRRKSVDLMPVWFCAGKAALAHDSGSSNGLH